MGVINFDVIVIGGGLAGLTSAIHLAKANFKVLVIEKQSYPRHKVCGGMVLTVHVSLVDSDT